MNRYVWDLRYDPAKQGPVFGGRGGGAGRAGGPGGPGGAGAEAPAGEEAPGGGRFGGGGAPQVMPGEYIVKLHVGARELTKPVKVDMDPRVPVSTADLQSQLDASLTLRDMMSRANTAVDRANTLVQQLTQLQNRLKAAGIQNDLTLQVNAALDATKKLLEEDLARPFPSMGYRQFPRLREEIQSLAGSVTRAPARPTDPEALRLKELQQELDGDVTKLNRIQGEQINRINEVMRGMPFIQTEIIK